MPTGNPIVKEKCYCLVSLDRLTILVSHDGFSIGFLEGFSLGSLEGFSLGFAEGVLTWVFRRNIMQVLARILPWVFIRIFTQVLWRIFMQASVHRNSVHCPWASRENTVLSYHLHLHLESIWTGTVLVTLGWVTGIQVIASWASGEHTNTMLSYSTAYAVWFNRYGHALVTPDWFHRTSEHYYLWASRENTVLSYQLTEFALWFNFDWYSFGNIGSGHGNSGHCLLGVPGAQNAQLFNCICSLVHLVWTHFGNTGSVHRTSEHNPWASGENTVLSYQLAVSALWFNLDCYSFGGIGSGHGNSGHCLWVSGEHTVLSYSTAHAVWLNLVGKRFDKTELVHGTSEHCPWASGEQTLLSYQLRMYFDSNSTCTVLVKSSLVSGMLVIASGHLGSTQCSAIQLHLRFGFNLVWQCLGKIGSGIWNAGHRPLWGSKEHTMLSY